MISNLFTAFVLLFSALARASWDLWAQSVIHIFTLLFIAYLFLKHENKINLIPSIDIPISLFIFICALSAINSYNIYESRNEFFNILNYIAIFYIARNTDEKYISSSVIITALLLSLYAFYQKYNNIGNISSSMINPNIFAGYLTGTICLVLVWTTEHKLISSRSLNLAYIFTTIILFTTLILTKSASGFISVLFGILLYLFIKKKDFFKKYAILALGLIILIITVKLIQKDTPNRIYWWITSLKMGVSAPFTGVGIGAFGNAFPIFKIASFSGYYVKLNTIYAHNSFLQIFAETGIFGISAFIAILFNIFRSQQILKHMSVLCAIAAIIFYDIFNYSLMIPANALLFWALLGILSKDIPTVTMNINANTKILLNWIVTFSISFSIYTISQIFIANREYAKGKYLLDTIWKIEAVKTPSGKTIYKRRVKNTNELKTAENHFLNSLKYDKLNHNVYGCLAVIYRYYSEILKSPTYNLESAIYINKYNMLFKGIDYEHIPENSVFRK